VIHVDSYGDYGLDFLLAECRRLQVFGGDLLSVTVDLRITQVIQGLRDDPEFCQKGTDRLVVKQFASRGGPAHHTRLVHGVHGIYQLPRRFTDLLFVHGVTHGVPPPRSLLCLVDDKAVHNSTALRICQCYDVDRMLMRYL